MIKKLKSYILKMTTASGGGSHTSGVTGYYKYITVLMICGAVMYIIMVSSLDTSSNQIVYTPMLTDDIRIRKLTNTTTKAKQWTEKPPGVVRTFLKVAQQNSEQDIPELGHDNQNQHTIISDHKIVLIVAYMRTGSTLTASLLQEYPGTFYAFEPIRFVVQNFQKLKESNDTSLTLKYLHNNQSRKYNMTERNDVIQQEMNSWLTCQLESLSIGSLTDNFHKHYTKIMKQFYYCFQAGSSRIKGFLQSSRKSKQPPSVLKNQQLREYYDSKKNIDGCLKTSINMCQKSPLIVLKFIRLNMSEVVKLLPFYPNMKVIHLVRDPRGILNSRFHVNAVGAKTFQKETKIHCDSVDRNLAVTKDIVQSYPDRIKILHYEDMAERPIEVSEEIAKFAGIEFTQSMKTYIHAQTASTRDSCSYCTQRKNSTKTAYKWQTQLTPDRINYIYETCRKTNEILGYLPFQKGTNTSRAYVDTRRLLLADDNF